MIAADCSLVYDILIPDRYRIATGMMEEASVGRTARPRQLQDRTPPAHTQARSPIRDLKMERIILFWTKSSMVIFVRRGEGTFASRETRFELMMESERLSTRLSLEIYGAKNTTTTPVDETSGEGIRL